MALATKPEISVSVTFKNTSALTDPKFEKQIKKIESWLAKPKDFGRDMDSVCFNPDRFELLVDTRGYNPQDIKCLVSNNSIVLIAESEEVSGTSQKKMSTSRKYDLPQGVIPEQTICCMSSEGILLVAAPWQK